MVISESSIRRLGVARVQCTQYTWGTVAITLGSKRPLATNTRCNYYAKGKRGGCVRGTEVIEGAAIIDRKHFGSVEF